MRLFVQGALTLLAATAFTSIAAQEVDQEDILLAADVSAEGIFSKGITIDEFIADDSILSFLSEGRDILDPGHNPDLKSKLQDLNNQLRDSKQSFEDATFEQLEAELFKLNDKFEAIYQRLLHFSRVLVSLTEDDMLAMADILIENKDYYDQIMDSHNLKVPSFLEKRFFEEIEGEINSSIVGSDEVSEIPTPSGKIDMEVEFKKYWDPDADYELFQNFMLEDVSGLSPNEKLNDLVQTSGILKKIKSAVGEVKYKVAMLLKLIKLKKLLRSKKSIACFALIKTIEKIKRCLKHIKYCIIMKIKKCLKNFPWNVIYKFKLLIRLIIKILLQILWELQYLICELLYKLYFLLKKLKKIPIAIIMYLKQLCEKDEWEDEWDDDEWDGDWDHWNDDKDDDWDGDDWDDDEDGFISYSFSPIVKTPTEIDDIFKGVFSKSEQKKIDKDGFNFDFEFDFDDDIDKKLDAIELEKRYVDIEDKIATELVASIANISISNSSYNQSIINQSLPSNLTEYDSRGSTVGSSIAGTYLLACLLIITTRSLFRFM